jgi:hypothetical protein
LHNKNHSENERTRKIAKDKAMLDKQGEKGKRIYEEIARFMDSI